MIIMFIFLGLTIVFIIGTAIYLNKNKKQNGFTQNIDKKENQGKKVDKKKLENILIQTSLSIDYPVQFFSTTEYIDTSKVIQLMKKNKNTNEKIEEYKNYLIDYLQNLMENRTISVVRSYAIISYDGTSQDAIQELNRKSLSFTSSLLRAKIVCEILTEDEIYDLIYKELNKNSTINISNLQGGGKNLYVGKKQKAKRNKHI